MTSKKKAAKKSSAKTTKKAVKKSAIAKDSNKISTNPSTKNVRKKIMTNKKVTNNGSKKVTQTTTASKKKTKSKKTQADINPDNLIHGIAPYVEKAREKYMNPNQVTHFRNILLAWKTNLLDEVSKTINLMQDENINHPDPNDRASQDTDMSLELRNRDRERKLLKKIDSTIASLDSDEYGWCERCGIEIGIRRLEARPTADLCVDCKTLNEIKERQMI